MTNSERQAEAGVGKPELVAPAGDWMSARAAIANGADAVYFGLSRFNARMRAENFTTEEVPALVALLHEHGLRAFCALNTLVFTDEVAEVVELLGALERAGVDAVIVQDVGLAALIQKLGLRLAVHASTQMTITSPEGVAFVRGLGIRRVVVARETSLRELALFRGTGVELEVFVHGALCVAYSGQCLTSEALGQRSANRGECAQACRLPYQLVVDGVVRDLGERRYLLSPQDLMAVAEIPALIRLGVRGFKIEGRLKTPEYVAATCQVYRQAIDRALENRDETHVPTSAERYQLEMVFSRGLYSGWLHGVNHQQLVHGRYGKKRGPLLGVVQEVGYDYVAGRWQMPVQPGDGVVFDIGGDPDHEWGGRVWAVHGDRLYFERGVVLPGRVPVGARVWKTSDPHLQRRLRRSFEGTLPRRTERLDMHVRGRAGEPLMLSARGVTVRSRMALQVAERRPLTTEFLRSQLGRLGGTRWELGELTNELQGDVILPVSELNRLRRELVSTLAAGTGESEQPVGEPPPARMRYRALEQARRPLGGKPTDQELPVLTVLCRTMEQAQAAQAAGVGVLYLDFEDVRRYAEAVRELRDRAAKTANRLEILLATPRIQKAGEQGFFRLIENAQPDGVLVRNLGGLAFYRERGLRRVGDFSLNVANPWSAELFLAEGLERVTAAFDLNARQVLDLLRSTDGPRIELVIHQHMPLFHMEHCVFAAFLSAGTDHTNCGRPCDRHEVRLRDRLGVEHPVRADVGCRNTMFHARAQSGAEFVGEFRAAGARYFRVELLDEDATETHRILAAYRQLLESGARGLVDALPVVRQLGVTSGTLTVLG